LSKSPFKKECPRCHRNCLEDDPALNSISHVGDKVEICSVCGKGQGDVGLFATKDDVEILMEERFRKELGVH